MERRRRLLGENHPESLISMNNYAVVLRKLGRLAEAEPLAQQALAAARVHPSLGPKHRDTRSFASTYAKLVEELGRDTEAAAIRREFDLPNPTTSPAARPPTQPATSMATQPGA
jgi:hypothetical protein